MSQQVLELAGLDLGPMPGAPVVIDLTEPALVRPAGLYVRVVKPAIDRAAGIVLCLLVVPLLVTVAVLVRVKLGPGVFYRQERVGLDGRTFRVHKFRTMLPDKRAGHPSVAYAGPDRRVCHKRDDDPRHTRFGTVLRKTSLDELPQFIDVALGHMSLVGPRPELASVVAEKYEPWQHRRHWVKPGITGLWQITMRGDGPMYLHTRVDLEYVERIGFGTDLRILARTIPSLARRVGH